MNLFKGITNDIDIKRFESIDAEPLFACEVRGVFLKRFFKRTPWLSINCNKKYKKKFQIRVALFLIPIIIIGALTGGICISINEYKKGYAENIKLFENVAPETPTADEDETEILLINSKNANKNNFTPCLENFEGIRCDKSVVKSLRSFLQAARENGFSLKLKAGYISADDLDRTYDETVKNLMENENYTQVRADDKAQKMVSNAKFSECTTGLLVEIVPSEDAQPATDSNSYRWLIRYCADYGFILRYPKNKESKTGRYYSPYCFRYVGKETAKKMRSLSKCLEEYCSYLKLDYKY